MTKEKLYYLHRCEICHKMWQDEKKNSECPNCGHFHIWLNNTSFLAYERAK